MAQCATRPLVLPLGCMRSSDGRLGYGMAVGGIPVGDSTFVRAFLETKVNSATSKATQVTDQLCDVHRQSLWTALYYALQPSFHYWLQHCYPADCAPHAARLDDVLVGVARVCIPGLCLDDDVTGRRFRLPARMYGGGIRSLEKLAPVAFAATACTTIPRLPDACSARGDVRAGCMPDP